MELGVASKTCLALEAALQRRRPLVGQNWYGAARLHGADDQAPVIAAHNNAIAFGVNPLPLRSGLKLNARDRNLTARPQGCESAAPVTDTGIVLLCRHVA
jgi:hypothetical protein